jgi:hypothetical protein
MGRTKNARSRSLGELELRKTLALRILDMLRTDPDIMYDPRVEDAIEEYERQLNSIQKQIDRNRPPDIIVGLKPGRLVGKALRG